MTTGEEHRHGHIAESSGREAVPGLAAMLERLLMMTDGTVTTMLEHLAKERLVTAGLRQSLYRCDPRTCELLDVSPEEELLVRRTDMVGESTGICYLEACSEIALGALPADLRDALLNTEEPIGRVLLDHRVETFREILTQDAPSVSSAARRTRQYRTFVGGVPAFLITESFFLDRLDVTRR